MKNEVKICKRIYNGDFGFGSIFEYINTFVLEDNVAETATIIEFCSDFDYKKDIIIIKDVVNLSDVSKNRVDEIINEFKTNNTYKENNTEDMPVFGWLKYVDVIINEENYEVRSDSDILLELKEILKFNENNLKADKKYNKCIQNIENNEK